MCEERQENKDIGFHSRCRVCRMGSCSPSASIAEWDLSAIRSPAQRWLFFTGNSTEQDAARAGFCHKYVIKRRMNKAQGSSQKEAYRAATLCVPPLPSFILKRSIFNGFKFHEESKLSRVILKTCVVKKLED